MNEKSLPALAGKSFEDLKQANTHGAEYWSARDLQSLTGLQPVAAFRTGNRARQNVL